MNPFPGRRRSILAQRCALTTAVISEEPKGEEKGQEQPQAEAVSLVGIYDCPKCGKHMKRGMAMHFRHCKGRR